MDISRQLACMELGRREKYQPIQYCWAGCLGYPVHTCHLPIDIQQIYSSAQTGQHERLRHSCCPVWALQHIYTCTCTQIQIQCAVTMPLAYFSSMTSFSGSGSDGCGLLPGEIFRLSSLFFCGLEWCWCHDDAVRLVGTKMGKKRLITKATCTCT